MLKTNGTTFLVIASMVLLGAVFAVLAQHAEAWQVSPLPLVAASLFGMGYRGRHSGGAGMPAADRVEEMIGRIESSTAFSASQQAAWDELAGALRAGVLLFSDLCDEIEDMRAGGDTAPQRLAFAEQSIHAAARAMLEVRPAFERFYATLDEAQKALLDRAFAGRPH